MSEDMYLHLYFNFCFLLCSTLNFVLNGALQIKLLLLKLLTEYYQCKWSDFTVSWALLSLWAGNTAAFDCN